VGENFLLRAGGTPIGFAAGKSKLNSTMPEPVSLYIIAYQEAANLREVLPTVMWADEVVVVDSFSTDDTAQVCAQFGVRHENVKFDGFGKLRNQALDLLKHDWVVSIDSDERCTPELAAEIRRELAVGPRFDAYHVPRKSYFLGRWMRHSGWYPDYRQPQFFNRKKMRYAADLVHESFELQGRLGYLREHALQFPWPTLEVAVAKLQRYSTLMAQRYAAKNRHGTLTRLLFSPAGMFLKVYFIKSGWRDGRHGFVLAMLYAYYTFLKYAKLWERQQKLDGKS
jgi:glycosyltransferase involved in cell wall biosynthesis